MGSNKTKKADERCSAHQPKAAPMKEQATRNLANPAPIVNPDLRSVLNTWRVDARSRAIQNEYATWVALGAGVRS